MPFFHSASRALSAAILFHLLALSSAQQCYYPDGTPSDDVPCSTTVGSSCCGSQAWCMDNGLCFRGGLVTRGSCSDVTWRSEGCTTFCLKDSPSTSVPVTPCTADGSFSCGLDSCQDKGSLFTMSGSGSLVLRASQVQQLVAPALAAAEAAGSGTPSDPAMLYTAAQLAGVGCGVGVPLLFAILTIVYLVYTRPRQNSIYLPQDSPDPRSDIRLQPPVRLSERPRRSMRSHVSHDGSESGYQRSSTGSQPEHLKAWSERYRVVNEKAVQVQPVRVREIRVELDASHEAQVQPHRHELGAPGRPQR